ncbi:MAG: DUF4493 domain-containing protein [Alistipes sp.]|nr:DUF4493 domain-containing protein [Alistipes sp.]
MKSFYNILLICVLALFALSSCVNGDKVNDLSGGNTPSEEKGVLTINVGSRTESGTAYDYILSIYKNEGGKSTLVRKYDSSKESMQKPEYIWLLAGNYTAKVECGTAVSATFNEKELYLYGEKDFDITAGASTTVDIVAVIQNIPVEVVFDQTIIDGFHDGYNVEVKADNNVKLTYTESKKGYFIMPSGVTNLSWHFVGTFEYDDNGELVNVDKSGTLANVELKKGYKLSFKFSKDATGLLGGLSVTVDESVEERDDHFAFNPDPVLKCADGSDIAVPYNYSGGERKYVATSPANFCKVLINACGKEYNPVESTVAGVTLSGLNTPQLYITFSEDFFNALSGGSQIIELRVEDVDGGAVTKDLPYNLQGVKSYNGAQANLWLGRASLSAMVFGSPTSAEIICREGEGEWQHFPAVASDNNTYTAQVEGIYAGHTYEYNLVIDGKTVGTSLAFSTPNGNQIPNGNLEDWCKDGDGVIIPYHTSNNPYWCTGNYGTAILSKNITQSSNDVRPGSKGTKSMYMDSEYIVVKFAAGNGYIGSWGGMSNGTNAKVYFGQPFEFNAKPKAIRFWAKWNCGKIDKIDKGVAKKGDPDLCKIFCCLTTDTHLVDSSNGKETTFSPSDADIKSGDARYDKVLYSAYMESTESQAEWKEITIPFTFYGEDPNQVPSHIILTFTCSGYGDFFDGSTESWLYVDDIELVY